ncbi:MAG TPA: type II secretion system F family protein [Verrucomicrobiae bacterium]|jgi:type II secretory pathway component PulF|nr:type II secretion system F family protein [Verrucomicrobiae bacterium]
MPLILSPRQLTRRAQFYQQIGQLTAAGVPVVSVLDMLQRSPPDASYVQRIRQMLTAISQGATVSDALRSLGDWTPAFDIALIEAGEKSGRLDAVCKLLGSYYDDRSRLLRQMISDLLYPAFVLHFAIFLFPMISLFQGGTMIGFVFKTVGVLAVIYGVVGWLIYAAQDRRGIEWRAKLERWLRLVPVLGTARQSLVLARLAAALEALITSGVNIIEAWDLAAAASGSPALQSAVREWRPAVVAGKLPSEAVRNCPLFPELFGNLYSTGEVSGQLDDSLKHLHTYYQEDGTRKMHLLAQWVPRFIYFAVAGLVAYKVISFYVGYLDEVNKAGNF